LRSIIVLLLLLLLLLLHISRNDHTTPHNNRKGGERGRGRGLSMVVGQKESNHFTIDGEFKKNLYYHKVDFLACEKTGLYK